MHNHCTFLFSFFSSLKMLSKHAVLPIMLWHQNTWNSEQAPLLSGGWHGGRKKEKRKKWPTWSCASSASLFFFFSRPFFFWPTFPIVGLETVSKCPHRLCLPSPPLFASSSQENFKCETGFHKFTCFKRLKCFRRSKL